MTQHQPRDVRREQVLDAALKLFVAHGYEDSTVDEIAREAGLSKGSIYWYFKSKLEILFELTDRYVAQSQAEVIRMAASDKYGTAALYKAHRDLRLADEKDPNREKLLGQLMALTARYPEIRGRMKDYYRKWDEVTAQLLDQSVKEGRLLPVNGKAVAQAIVALYDGLTLRQQIDPEVNLVEVIETTMKLVHDALTQHLKTPSRPTPKELA
jgi:AcrR family transcriptional regulator